MKKFITKIFLSTILLLILVGCSNKIDIVDNSSSKYKIVISKDATRHEVKAANELSKYLNKIADVDLSITDDTEVKSEFEIVIGKTSRGKDYNFSSLEKDGFHIFTNGNNLNILGGSDKGALYGVYTFLESYLGCRMYTPEVLEIPKSKSISIDEINDKQIPQLTFRELHLPSARYSKAFCDWHKLHHYTFRDSTYGSFVHTFKHLVPPEKYFKTNPEYFSEVNGIRISDNQLCLTNPDVLDVVIKELERKMAERPDAVVWDVSQNDTFGNCTCENCSKLDEKHGSPAGSMIAFVNKVARHFPDKTISTLAYQYTRKAPVGIKPEPNVMVVLCTIECDRNIPISKNEKDLFNRDIKEWSAITDNIKIWDYVIQFTSYCDPFPNFRTLQPNVKLFVDHGVKSLFEQGSGGSKSDLHEMKAYILSKLMWNPDTNVNALIDDFMNGYYGPAAKHVKDYFTKVHDAVDASNKSLIIYGFPTHGMESYLTPELLKEYSRIFDEAEKSVADQTKYLDRVKTARSSVEFAILEIAKRNASEDLYIFKIKDDKVTVNPKMKERLNNFVAVANKAGIKNLHESGGDSPDEYKEKMEHYFEDGMIIHKAYKKNVDIISKVHPNYEGNGSQTITDGIKGENNFKFNWVGFEEQEFEAIVDLENETEVSFIRTDFLQETKSWIWLPKKVNYFISNDGVNFKKVGTAVNKVDEKRKPTFVETFKTNFNKQKARYVKVKTESLINVPKWHIGHNNGTGKAWLFIDEIVVK